MNCIWLYNCWNTACAHHLLSYMSYMHLCKCWFFKFIYLFMFPENWRIVALFTSATDTLSRRGVESERRRVIVSSLCHKQEGSWAAHTVPAQQSVWSAVEYLNSHPAPNINPEPKRNNTGIYMQCRLFLHDVIVWNLFSNTSWCTVMQRIWKMNKKIQSLHYCLMNAWLR